MPPSGNFRKNKYKSKDEGASKNGRILAQRRKKLQDKTADETVESVVGRYADFEKLNASTLKKFSDFPLSRKTIQGVEDCDYTEPTEIQRESLRFTLTGSDVVAAAKTGSGKTLALVIPVLECLWRSRWSPEYGLGAVIISPTRELALQTFTCINHVGKNHHFSCALLIGGTDVSYERNRLGRINIIVCTPGRLLQHMDENEQLSCDQLQMLVLDEADRILDMGFSKQINAIISNLPKERQTLLFSATQTRNVKDLVRVCTKDPVFVSVHEHSSVATPEQLKQSYLVCEDHEKLNTLWSFVKRHKKMKTLVFVTSCKQARFLTEAFCHLRPGVSVMGLWGTMNQTKRIDVFQKFEDSSSAVLIATDVASRGLDFSDVDWVIQMDAPATVDDYIHRVGRTARMQQKGQAVIFVTPRQENAMIGLLKQRAIPIEKLIVDPDALIDIRAKLQSVIAQFPEINQFAQKSITSYLRGVYLMREKSVFDVEAIDVASLAASFGLVAVPRLRFLSKKGISTKNAVERDPKVKVGIDSKSDSKSNSDSTKLLLSDQFSSCVVDEDEEDLFTVKSKDVFNVLTDKEKELMSIPGRDNVQKDKRERVVTKAKTAKKILKKGLLVNNKKVFGDEGDLLQETGPSIQVETAVGLDLAEAKKEMKERDTEDRKRMKAKKKEKKQLEKAKLRKKKTDDLDLCDDGGGSGFNSDAELDWLPDPDMPRKAQSADSDGDVNDDMARSEPPRKRKRAEEWKQTEAEALALLDPF